MAISKTNWLIVRRRGTSLYLVAGLAALVLVSQLRNGNDAAAAPAVARAQLSVSVRVADNCAALLSSSTTSVASSSACRNSAIVTTLAPTITSTSLSTLAPMVLSGQGANLAETVAAAAPAGAPLPASVAKGAVTQQFNALDGVVTAGLAPGDFIVSAAEQDGQIVMITY